MFLHGNQAPGFKQAGIVTMVTRVLQSLKRAFLCIPPECLTACKIHDVAEFLGGDLNTKNQHILIVYIKTSKQMASSHAVAIPPSENNSALKLALQSSSILSTSPVLRVDSAPQEGVALAVVNLKFLTRIHEPVLTDKSQWIPLVVHRGVVVTEVTEAVGVCVICTVNNYMLSLLNLNSVDKKMGKSMVIGNFVSQSIIPDFANISKCTLCTGRRSSTQTSPTGSNKVDNSHLLHLFNQLKTEILQWHTCIMEKTFILIQELFTAAEKSFNLKKYFWKSPDLFVFMVGQLQQYMPQSCSQSSLKKGSNREEELDFVVVLLQTLVCLFRETDILSTQLMVIKARKGEAVKDLLKCIVLHPLTTSQQPVGISPAAQLLLSGADKNMFTVGDREQQSDKLFREALDNATSLLFELMCPVHQANCFSVEDKVLNIFWLMKIVEAQEQTNIQILKHL
ncbi:Uncharacterized protein C12orf56-like [Stylophora pistillata]|uniref:Uncharacterized protein C12orf56-like n=1 Tax=Stylophora pistillata TaxID=50429 RepID=A0A2B4SMN1_STYPI|nr:Uncharacterized protein C12orf56-like [Stylophora pistillata]